MQLSETNNELVNIAPKLLAVSKTMPYCLPDNDYFEHLSTNTLLSIAKHQTTYSVPEGYFDQLSNQLLLQVSKPVADAGTMPSVPEGFFDGFANSVLAKIKAAEQAETQAAVNDADAEDALPAIFSKISKEMPYEVPTGYFDNTINIPSDTKETGKIIPLKPKKNNWFKYAAAVVAAGLMVTSVINMNSGNDEVPAIQVASAQMPTSIDIDDEGTDAVDSEFVAMLAQLDNATLDNDEKEEINTKNVIGEDIMADDIESSLKNISDSDLVAFLSTVGIN